MPTPIRIKTFRSSSLQEAIEMVRREFGPNAAILDTKSTKGGMFSRSRIEVTASSETAAVSAQPAESISTELSAVELAIKTNDPAPAAMVNGRFSETPTQSRLDFANGEKTDRPSNENVESTLKPGAMSRDTRIFEQVLDELIDAGLDSRIARQWIDAAKETSDPTTISDVWTLRAEILKWVREFVYVAQPIDFQSGKRQVLLFVGPTGVGKTTTLAKVASNLSIDQKLRVGVLQTGTRDVSDQVKLGDYAAMLNWKTESASSLEDVQPCLDRLADCDVVLVDTPGCSPSDSEGLSRLQRLHDAVKPTITHLVVSSTCNERSFLRVEAAFKELNPDSLILTKLDESGGLGPLFSCLQNSSIPISCLADGQRIPADLMEATSNRVAQRVLGVLK